MKFLRSSIYRKIGLTIGCVVTAMLILNTSHFFHWSYRLKKKYLRAETHFDLINKKKFKAKIGGSIPIWMQEQIAEDFQAFFKSGISKAQVDATFSKIRENYPHPYLVRYRIARNQLYRYFPEEEPISLLDCGTEKALKTLMEMFRLKDVDFILSYLDGPDPPSEAAYTMAQEELQAPILFSAKIKGMPYVVLIPDWRSISNWWANDIQNVLTLMRHLPWEQKKESAFWSGGLTKALRIKLCQLAKLSPEDLKATINGEILEPYWKELIQKEELAGERVLLEEFLAHKYLPSLDGVCCAAPAFQWRLLSNCVTLKQESDEIQWFYRAVKPYEHYIPISNDFGDVFEKIQWARKHDRQCQEIASRSTEFALNNLMLEDVYLYFYLVIKQYAALQTLERKELEEEIKKDPRWVNISSRRALKKIARKNQMAGYQTLASTP